MRIISGRPSLGTSSISIGFLNQHFQVILYFLRKNIIGRKNNDSIDRVITQDTCQQIKRINTINFIVFNTLVLVTLITLQVFRLSLIWFQYRVFSKVLMDYCSIKNTYDRLDIFKKFKNPKFTQYVLSSWFSLNILMAHILHQFLL